MQICSKTVSGTFDAGRDDSFQTIEMEESETEFKISQRQQLPKDESEIRSAKNEQGQSEAQNDFDPEQYMLGEATFWQQLKATIIRNLIRKRRGLRQTLNVSFLAEFGLFRIYFLAMNFETNLIFPPTFNRN